MNKITVSAPGKLMLLGEHAVVAGKPCIVTAVNQRIQATVEFIDAKELQVEAPDVKVTGYKKSLDQLGNGEVPKEAKFVEIAVKNFFESHSKLDLESRKGAGSRVKHGMTEETGIKITTKSQFSSQFGFGSSSAVTVCVIKALAELYKVKLSNKEVFDLSYKTVLDIQGKGSGFDIAAAIYGGTLYFVTGGKVIEPLPVQSLPLVVGYSGVKADTVTLMNKVSEQFKNDKEGLDRIYQEIEQLVNQAKAALLSQNFVKVGDLMDDNQKLLVSLGVSIPKLDNMISAANSSGAFGAKLSGAGGGDCMIALCSDDKKEAVEKAIAQAGGEILQVQPNAEGAKIESIKGTTSITGIKSKI